MKEQENIYNILLEIKEISGETNARLKIIEDKQEKQDIDHKELRKEHNDLKISHESHKGKFLFYAGATGSLITFICNWIWTKITGQ